MVWRREIETKQPKHRCDQSFGLAQRQAEDRPQRQRRRDCQPRVARLAAARGAWLGLPPRNRGFGEPHGQAPTLAQGDVIGGPIRHSVPLLRDVMTAILVRFEWHGDCPGSGAGPPSYTLHSSLPNDRSVQQGEADGQLALGFVEIDEERQEAWEYAVLVTSLEAEVLTIGQLYRDRGDCENSFDELKNHWGWGGFTTHDLTRCRIMARIVALIFNWWNLFVRLADPDHHREAITSRPLLLQAIGRQTNHAGRATVTISSTHGERGRARRALTRIAAFFATLRETAEQLTDLDRWYRILSHALVKYLKGRQLDPPRRLQAA